MRISKFKYPILAIFFILSACAGNSNSVDVQRNNPAEDAKYISSDTPELAVVGPGHNGPGRRPRPNQPDQNQQGQVDGQTPPHRIPGQHDGNTGGIDAVPRRIPGSLDSLPVGSTATLKSASGNIYSGEILDKTDGKIIFTNGFELNTSRLAPDGAYLTSELQPPPNLTNSAPTTQREIEEPYSYPPGMHRSDKDGPIGIAAPGESTGLAPDTIYLWVIDRRGEIRLSKEYPEVPTHFYGGDKSKPRGVKHRDLVPYDAKTGQYVTSGPNGGPAKLGGELKVTYDPQKQAYIVDVNLDSSYAFARVDGQRLDRDQAVADYATRLISQKIDGRVIVRFKEGRFDK